jgi:hypothetical protein
MVQDPVVKNLLFVATESGIYTSLDSGKVWNRLPGTPNMGIRDLVIQKRENDLVAASFGRGFFVLDDYSALREMTPDNLKKEAKLYSPRPAKWYNPKSTTGNTGADYYFAKNPTFGAVFTYHLNGDFSSSKQKRMKKEAQLNKANSDIPFPGWDALENEKNEKRAKVWLSVKDSDGNIINNISQIAKKGTQKISWNLRHSSSSPIDPDRNLRGQGRSWRSWGGPMAIPGKYTASIYLEANGKYKLLDGPVDFDVNSIRDGVLKGADYETYNSYRNEFSKLQTNLALANKMMSENSKLLNAYKISADKSLSIPGILSNDLAGAEKTLLKLQTQIQGYSSRSEIGERNPPSIQTHLRAAGSGMRTTYGPTGLHKKSLSIASKMLSNLMSEVMKMHDKTLPQIKSKLKAIKAPDVLRD